MASSRTFRRRRCGIPSFAPLGLARLPIFPTADAVGCILAPLRGFASRLLRSRQTGPSRFFQIPFAAVALLALAGCRQDMHDQPRFKPFAQSDFYTDLRSARPPVEGTVAQGQLHDDTYFHTGKMGASPGDYMPFPVTDDVVARGQQRFNIYCSPCHSRLGDGNGMIVQRGYKRPPSYHTDRLRKAPLGYFFDVITNGFGAMPDYASQIPARDRWCIIAYIRVLQLSQGAGQGDVPEGQAVPSVAPTFVEPGSGATLPEVDPAAGEHHAEGTMGDAPK